MWWSALVILGAYVVFLIVVWVRERRRQAKVIFKDLEPKVQEALVLIPTVDPGRDGLMIASLGPKTVARLELEGIVKRTRSGPRLTWFGLRVSKLARERFATSRH